VRGVVCREIDGDLRTCGRSGRDSCRSSGRATLDQLTDALGALDRHLGPEQIVELEAQVNPEQIAGARYQPAQMAHLDSER
jgi:hypothetical protein